MTNVRLFLLLFSHIIKSPMNHWSRWPSLRNFVFNSHWPLSHQKCKIWTIWRRRLRVNRFRSVLPCAQPALCIYAEWHRTWHRATNEGIYNAHVPIHQKTAWLHRIQCTHKIFTCNHWGSFVVLYTWIFEFSTSILNRKTRSKWGHVWEAFTEFLTTFPMMQ